MCTYDLAGKVVATFPPLALLLPMELPAVMSRATSQVVVRVTV